MARMLWPIPTRCLRTAQKTTRPASWSFGSGTAWTSKGRSRHEDLDPQGDDAAKADLTHHIGYDLLGPVVQRWLLALHQHLLFHDDGSTVALFCARAGVRISELYDLFLADRMSAAGPREDVLGVGSPWRKGVFDTPHGGSPASTC
jgi:hypothetical protein